MNGLEAERIVHTFWSGPRTLQEVKTMHGPADKGLYQVYAHHPVYGKELVYIGMTCATFAARIPGEAWGIAAENDPQQVQYYLGRLRGPSQPPKDAWDRDIAAAEAILIHSHAPAYNMTLNMRAPDPPQPASGVALCHLRRRETGSTLPALS